MINMRTEMLDLSIEMGRSSYGSLRRYLSPSLTSLETLVMDINEKKIMYGDDKINNNIDTPIDRVHR